MSVRPNGFTLLELMIVLAIAAILASAAVPAMRTLVLESGQRSLANDLLASLQLARSEAIKRRQTVRLCPSQDGESCSTNRADWNNGWLVEARLGGGGTERLHAARNERNGHTVSANQNAFTFTPFPTAVAEGAGTLIICDQRGAARAREVRVRESGNSQVRVGEASC